MPSGGSICQKEEDRITHPVDYRIISFSFLASLCFVHFYIIKSNMIHWLVSKDQSKCNECQPNEKRQDIDCFFPSLLLPDRFSSLNRVPPICIYSTDMSLTYSYRRLLSFWYIVRSLRTDLMSWISPEQVHADICSQMFILVTSSEKSTRLCQTSNIRAQCCRLTELQRI